MEYPPEQIKISIYGLYNDVSFHLAKYCAEDLRSGNPEKFAQPEITGMLEFDWDLFIDAKKKELRGDTWAYDDKALIFVDNRALGNAKTFLEYAQKEHQFANFRPDSLYQILAEESYKGYLNSTKHDFVFMDFSIGEEPAGRIVFELFTDIVPKTCANFLELCTGERGESESTEYKLHYLNSIIHRVVKNGWIQGGDIWMKTGNGGESIYGAQFEDENFAIKHSRRGILGMANKGRHTNNSQFYITLQATPWMDTKYVAFGQVIEGTKTLEAIESQSTNNERPHQEVLITDCGRMTYEF